ncbi:uncharacterized protein LOC111300619 isoform X2 [Durio zibethinus]|uniref:Uncharacterized protein LOC111300619 isoform X2 n=1 Tax=Durio zibethinus TaxID=66656 RepID=A0A6P5ZHL9_DURZI|nr:uncharacterized protein LOC111300619 isoform X2 [Durio zibethinus]
MAFQEDMRRRICSKRLAPTDISKRLAIPTKSLAFFPSSRSRPMEFPVHEEESSGRVWTFACSIRKTGFKKPVLQKEWLLFVDFHDLRVGDVVTIYEHVSEDEIKLFVEAERKRGRDSVSSIWIVCIPRMQFPE